MFYQFNNLKIKIPFPLIDIYLFHWRNMNPSKIHNHSKNGCYLFLIKGSIQENIYNSSLKNIKKKIYKAPSLSYIHNKIGYHSIQPLQKSISIHIYHPKNENIKFFN